METRLKNSSKAQTDRILHWTSLALAILGALDALYLLTMKYTQSEAMCVGNHGCTTVNNSIYSVIYGIPISVFGVGAYLVIAAILMLAPKIKLARESGSMGIFGISMIGVLFSAYLTYLEADVIHAFCPFCLASATIITLIFILAIIQLILHPAF